MSDRPIAVGDLVMIVWPCCSYHASKVFTVMDVIAYDATGVCKSCGHTVKKGTQLAAISDRIGYPLSWLKRIPPMSELEGERSQEKLTEPA